MGLILALSAVLVILIGTIIGSVVLQQRRMLRARSVFAGRLLVAQDEERARIARDLHDAVVQRLTSATHALRAQDGRITESQAEELDGIAEELRTMARGLHPAGVQRFSLEGSLRDLARTLARQGQLGVEVTARGPVDQIAGDLRLAIYRIAQEALRNAVRHAGARQVQLTLAVVPGAVQLVVTDDGRGFETGGSAATSGLGLTSMEERARLLGGRLEVQSVPGVGTTVAVQLPMTPAAPG